jgi:hypothetical protein
MRALYFCAAFAALTCYTEVCADDKKADGTMPGFPDIKADVSLLNVSLDGMPVLKVVKGSYNEKAKTVSWVVQLERDVPEKSPESKAIDTAWSHLLAEGPMACFFDEDNVMIGKVKMNIVGTLEGGRKGDCIRLVVSVERGLAGVARMEVRHP